MENNHGHKLIKNSVLDLFNTLFIAAGGWILSIWITRQLGPNNYGIFSLVLWFTGTFSWIIGMGFIHATTKFIAEYNGKGEIQSLGPIVLFIMKIEIFLTLAIVSVLIFFVSPIADYFFTPSESFLFLLAFLGLIPGTITAVFSATIEGIQKFIYFTYAGLIISPFSFIAKIAVLLMGKGVVGLLIVMIIFSIVNCVFYYFVLKKEKVLHSVSRAVIDTALKKRIHRYNLNVLIIILCDKVVWDKSENFFLGRLCSATEIGFYNLGFNICQKFTSVLPSTFWRVLFPAMSSYFGTGDIEKTRRLFFVTTRYLAFFAFPVGVGGAILAYQMIHYLYGHDFIGTQRVLQIMFLSSIVTSLCGPAGSAILYGYEKQSFIYKLGIIMAVFNIILDLIFIKPYGAIGAAACYAATTVTGSVLGTLYTCRIMKLKYPIQSIFKIFFSTIIMAIAMEMILLQNPFLPGFIFSFIIGICVYSVCALVLGTFEQEDLTIMRKIQSILPGKMKKVVDIIILFIALFRNNVDSLTQGKDNIQNKNEERHEE